MTPLNFSQGEIKTFAATNGSADGAAAAATIPVAAAAAAAAGITPVAATPAVAARAPLSPKAIAPMRTSKTSPLKKRKAEVLKNENVKHLKCARLITQSIEEASKNWKSNNEVETRNALEQLRSVLTKLPTEKERDLARQLLQAHVPMETDNKENCAQKSVQIANQKLLETLQTVQEDERNEAGLAVLREAILYAQSDLVEQLLKSGITLKDDDEQVFQCLNAVVKTGNLQIATMLLKTIPRKKFTGCDNSALHTGFFKIAIKHNDNALLDLLVAQGWNPVSYSDEKSAFNYAMQINVPMALKLLEYKKVQTKITNILPNAVRLRCLPVLNRIRQLVQGDSYPTFLKSLAAIFKDFIRRGDQEELKILTEFTVPADRIAFLTSRLREFLKAHVTHQYFGENKRAIQILIALGADLNEIDAGGMTVFSEFLLETVKHMPANSHGMGKWRVSVLTMVKEMMEMGADPFLKNGDAALSVFEISVRLANVKTAVLKVMAIYDRVVPQPQLTAGYQQALLHDCFDACEILKGTGADVQEALVWACERGVLTENRLKQLIGDGADPVKDHNSIVPVLKCCEDSDFGNVEMMLKYNFDWASCIDDQEMGILTYLSLAVVPPNNDKNMCALMERVVTEQLAKQSRDDLNNVDIVCAYFILNAKGHIEKTPNLVRLLPWQRGEQTSYTFLQRCKDQAQMLVDNFMRKCAVTDPMDRALLLSIDEAMDEIEDAFRVCCDELGAHLFGIMETHYVNHRVLTLREQLTAVQRGVVDSIDYMKVLSTMFEDYVWHCFFEIYERKFHSYNAILRNLTEQERKDLNPQIYFQEFWKIFEAYHKNCIESAPTSEGREMAQTSYQKMKVVFQNLESECRKKNLGFEECFQFHFSWLMQQIKNNVQKGTKCVEFWSLFKPDLDFNFVTIKNTHRSQLAVYEQIDKDSRISEQKESILVFERGFHNFLKQIINRENYIGIPKPPETFSGRVKDTCDKLEKEWRKQYDKNYMRFLQIKQHSPQQSPMDASADAENKLAASLSPEQLKQFIDWQIKKETTYLKIEDQLRMIIFGAYQINTSPDCAYCIEQSNVIIDQILQSMQVCATGWIGDFERLAQGFLKDTLEANLRPSQEVQHKEREEKRREGEMVVAAPESPHEKELHGMLANWRREILRSWAKRWTENSIQREFEQWLKMQPGQISAAGQIIQMQDIRSRFEGREVHFEYAIIEACGQQYGISDSQVIREDIEPVTDEMRQDFATYFSQQYHAADKLVDRIHADINRKMDVQDFFLNWIEKNMMEEWRKEIYGEYHQSKRDTLIAELSKFKEPYEKLFQDELPKDKKESEIKEKIYDPLWKALKAKEICGAYSLSIFQENLQNALQRLQPFERLQQELTSVLNQRLVEDRRVDFMTTRVRDQEDGKIKKAYVRHMLLTLRIIGVTEPQEEVPAAAAVAVAAPMQLAAAPAPPLPPFPPLPPPANR